MNNYTHHFKITLLWISLLSYMTASSTGKLSKTFKVDGNTYKVDGSINIGKNNVGSMNSNKDVKNDSDTGTFSFDNTIATNSNGVPYRCPTGFLEICAWAEKGDNDFDIDSCDWNPAKTSDLKEWKKAMKWSAKSWRQGAEEFEKMSEDFERTFGPEDKDDFLEDIKEFQDEADHALWMGEHCKIKYSDVPF
jgi:hypothetical protein